MFARTERATSMVQVLSALVIVALLIGFFAPQMLKGRGGPEAQVKQQHAAVDEARDTVCKTNLDQIRRLVAQMRTTAGNPPRSLSDLGLSSDATRCPAGDEPYTYSSSTGEVHCVHPGHESF